MRWKLPLLLGAWIAMAFAAGLYAHPDGLSVAVNFAADEPPGVRSDVLGPAGELGTANWNNLDLANGGGEFDPVFLNADDSGEEAQTGVTITWASNNTWSSTGRGNEENNTAPPGDDRNLMTGYLDTTNDSVTTVTVEGLDEITDDAVRVYVYINGGVIGRGGDFQIGDDIKTVVDTAPFDGLYVEGENFVVFENVEGPGFTLTATATTPATGTRRAVINAIEVVTGAVAPRSVPERELLPETDADTCPPNGRGPLRVRIFQPLIAGQDPSEMVTVSEEVRGRFFATDVSTTAGGVVADLPQDPLAPIGAFADHRDIVVNPICSPQNGDTTFIEPDTYILTNTGEDVWMDGDTFQFAYNNMRGDFDVSVHVSERVPALGSRWGKHGIMARQDLTTRSRYTTTQDAIGDVDPLTGAVHNNDDSTMQAGRRTHGGDDNFENQPFPVNPSGDGIDDYCDGIGPDDGACTVVHHDYLRLERVGNVFNSYSREFPGDEWTLLGSHDWGPGAPEEVLVGLYATSHSTLCFDQIEITFDEWNVASGEVVPASLPGIGVTIEWNVTRQQLADGIEYTVDLTEGQVSMLGTVADKAILGSGQITLECDTRVTDVGCVENGDGSVTVTWENHPFADTSVDIAVETNGAASGTVPGTETSFTVPAPEIADGFNRVCVINSSFEATCCTFLRNGLIAGDFVAGGDGTGTADPDVVGISADTGTLETVHNNMQISNTGDNPQAVDDMVSPFIDSVFIIEAIDPFGGTFFPINTAGVEFEFGPGDATGVTYNHIIRDVTHDIDKPITEIWAGGDNTWVSALSIHAAAGVTLDLGAIRAAHGELGSFTAFAGTDQCDGTVTLYVIASDDVEPIDSVSVDALGNNLGEPVDFTIPEDAAFLTLAVGANDGSIGCAHGVFANAAINLRPDIVVDEPTFVRGDTDSSGGINLTDGVRTLNWLFTGGADPECIDAADADDSGTVNLTDAVYTFNWLFTGGPDPLPPTPSQGEYAAQDCGEDPSADSGGTDLGCLVPAGKCPQP